MVLSTKLGESIMQNRYPLQQGRNFLKAFALIMGMMICGNTLVEAQLFRPQVPQLSLIPRPNPNGNGNGTNYPDDRIYVPKAVNQANEPREILVPVFMRNCFINGTDPRYNAFPIYSFEFKVQYDERVFRAVGIERFGPLASDTNSLAKEFTLSYSDSEDDTYQQTLNVTTPNRFFGRRIRITGSSTKPLPPTGQAGQEDLYDPSVDCNSREFQELLYIRFRVVGTSSGVGTTNTPIIITNDTLRYNDLDVAKESPFPGTQEYPNPAPGDLDYGLFGLNRLTNPAEPIRPGVIYAVITDIPRFSFLPNVGVNAKVRQISNSQWELFTPIVVEDGATINPFQNPRGTQSINVIADPSISFTRLTDISVESSAAWLKFMTFGPKNPIPTPTRYGEIEYIDNGILGPGGPGFQNADQTVTTQADPLLNFRIVVDPSQLPEDVKDSLDASGIYVGYITFRSASAEFSPVRLKVTFINVRRPNEPNATNAFGRGIKLEVARVGTAPDTSRLLLGTGLRATDGVDTLFGEFAYPDPQDTVNFNARLFPPAVSYFVNGQEFFRFPFNSNDPNDGYETYRRDYLKALANGFGDLTGDYESRDIRNSNDDSTLFYTVKFERGAGFSTSQVTVTWDTQDFPQEGQVYMRDLLNGSRLNFDMRTGGTSIGGTRRSVTINDANVDAFVVEYTLPKVISYPITKKGWNLLSLPVRPSSTTWDAIYPNRLTEFPIVYSKGIYQDAAFPKVGLGYFVEFGDIVDSAVAGARLLRIDARDTVTITEGWNTIGSLSVPINIDNIGFEAVPNQQLPRRTGSVYGYVTDQGYVEVSQIIPGLGYWIKTAAGTGYLRLESGSARNIVSGDDKKGVYASSAKINITDSKHNGELYLANHAVNAESFELPPVPPAGLFDVRFTNNSNVAVGDAAIRLQGMQYPVNVSIANTNEVFTVANAVTGEILGTAGKGQSVEIKDSKVKTIKILSNTIEASNFDVTVSPNPVANVANITYTVPAATHVSVKVFNALGQEVQTLVNGFVAKGTTPMTFDANTLPSGQYLVKFVAGETLIVRTITVSH
jgi:hypothetical protein